MNMKFKNTRQLIKLIICLFLIVLVLVLRVFIEFNYLTLVLVILLSLFIAINSGYYYFKTGVYLKDDTIILNYSIRMSSFNFASITKVTINKKELISVNKVLDKEKASNVLYLKTKDQEYYLKNMFSENQIYQIINALTKGEK